MAEKSLQPYLTKMKFKEDGKNKIDRDTIEVGFGLYSTNEGKHTTEEFWSGSISVSKFFAGLKKGGCIAKSPGKESEVEKKKEIDENGKT